jgi:hypothetical protein
MPFSRFLVAAAAAACAAVSLSARQPAPYVAGRIIDADTGLPIAGATIHLSGRRNLTARTNADGRYQSGTLLPAMYTLTVTADGYLPALSLYAGRVPLRLRVREDGIGPAIVQKDWMLERAASIRGRVLGDGDTPLEGVTVIAARRTRIVDGWPEFDAKGTATTGADGRFAIGHLPRGAYFLVWQLQVGGQNRWFYSPGIIDPRHAAQVEAVTDGWQAIDLRSVSAPFPAVQVRTLAPGGVPAHGAAVEIELWRPFPSQSNSETIAAVTDSSGRGALRSVPVGRHRLRARIPESGDAPATARADMPLEVPAQLSGVDIRLKPAVHACLFTRAETDGASAADLRTPPIISARTGDGALDIELLEGRATLGDTIRMPGLLPGSMLQITALAQGSVWQLSRVSPSAPAAREVIPIDAAAAGCAVAYFRRTSQFIRGRVVLGDSEWVPDVAIIATPVDAPAAPVAISTMTDDGSFHLPGIAMGMVYSVIAVPSGFSPDSIPADLRHVIKATGGDTISIPLSLPIAR